MTAPYDAARNYIARELCLGSTTNIMFQSKAAVQGVDPETDTAETFWEPWQIRLRNSKAWNPITGMRPPIVQEANLGPGGLNGRFEPLIGWHNQEGHIGANARPDLQMVIETPNLWYKYFDYDFTAPLVSQSQPQPGLNFDQVSGSPTCSIQPGGSSLAPELLIDAPAGAACRLRVPAASCYPSIKSRSHYIFRLWYAGYSRFRFGWRTADDQHSFEFYREDVGATESNWRARTRVGGSIVGDVDLGVKTGASRTWFIQSYDQSVNTPAVNTLSSWIGSVPGEFPPGANVPIMRNEFQPASLPNFGVAQYAPFFEWTNLHPSATRQLAIWRVSYWRT